MRWLWGCNSVKDPANGRVASGPPAPRRECRPSPSPGTAQQRRCASAVHTTCSCRSRPSGQRDRQGKNRHPERRRIATHCSRIAQGGRRSACRQSRSQRHQADSVCVRGPSHQNAAPCEHVADARKQSASPVPLILGGVTGHSPVRRGSARRAAASAQGKAFPYRIRYTTLG